jgi:hypothetical protein
VLRCVGLLPGMAISDSRITRSRWLLLVVHTGRLGPNRQTLAIAFKAGAPRRHHRRGALDPRMPFQLSSAGGMWWLPLNRSLGS